MEDPTERYSMEEDGSILVVHKEGQDSWNDFVEINKNLVDDVGSDNDNAFLEPNELSEDECLNKIQEVLADEQRNFQLLQKSNNIMAKIISHCSRVNLTQTDYAQDENKPKTQLVNTPPPPASEKLSKKLFRKVSNPFRRRRFNHGNTSPDIQAFVKDYYQSLSTVSRYIIFASFLSFCTAFVLLSLYGAQVHSYDIIELKANREQLDKHQLAHEHFREALIHQRYEENRNCQASLESCQAKQSELIAELNKLKETAGKSRVNLEATVESQRKEILALKQQNQNLTKEIGKMPSSFYQLLFFTVLLLIGFAAFKK